MAYKYKLTKEERWEIIDILEGELEQHGHWLNRHAKTIKKIIKKLKG